MANPFLMMDDEALTSSPNDVTSNPFLIQDNENDSGFVDNPFAGQQTNPFAAFDEEEEVVALPDEQIKSRTNSLQTADPAMSFFGTTIIDTDDESVVIEQKQPTRKMLDDANTAYSSEEELTKRKPPPRPVPPSQTTQELIFAVADQLDQASSHLLGRLPATRTPSPVSMRDIQTPSPTPDIADLLDVSDIDITQNDVPNDGVDNSFGVANNKPQRPRPPPPRPVPPRPSLPNVLADINQSMVEGKAQNPEPDLFDMFGDAPPKPPAPKTKEDILSLFSAPKPMTQQHTAQPDLLSGDILMGSIPLAKDLPPPFSEVISKTSTTAENTSNMESLVSLQNENEADIPVTPFTTITEPDVIPQKKYSLTESHQAEATVEQLGMYSITPVSTNVRAPTPDIEITTVESLPRSDDEEENEPQIINTQSEPELESELDADLELEKADSEISLATESNITTQAQNGSPIDYNIPDQISEPEQMDTGLDFAPSTRSGSASVNPFASPENEDVYQPVVNNLSNTQPLISQQTNQFSQLPANDEFDMFSAKFDSAKKEDITLLEGFGATTPVLSGDAWGDTGVLVQETTNSTDGFGTEDTFDSFLTMQAPTAITRNDSIDSIDNDKEFNVVIRPKDNDMNQGIAPILAPPPRSSQNNSMHSGDSSPRVNPFDKGDEVANVEGFPGLPEAALMQRTDSQETPPTPLFDEDVSQPLEDFPRIHYVGPGWEMQLRQPNKKKITGQRFWKKVFVKITYQSDNPVVQLYNQSTDKDPFQELPLQPCYSVSEIGAQQYDQFGKIFTMKLQYIFYKERPGVRPGQVTKAERITNKLSQFAAYAIQGDYQGVKEFGSDLKKLGLPVEHAPQVSQLFKLGSMSYEDMKQFSMCVEEAVFRLSAHRDRALTYKLEEVQITAVDELYVEQDAEGHVHKQIARVRLFFLGFLSGMPSIELGVNDLRRQGKEVVGRHDIIPVVTEEWIRLEGVEFHDCVQQDVYEKTKTIKFLPPDACYIELMRFRVRPPKNRELPFQLKATWCVTGNRVELRADVLVPGFASRKLGQIPCEDVAIRFPIPECWIYLFRVEKHFRYGSKKSAHRRTGKVKGIERILGAVDTLQESLIEVTSGQAKYEHHHRAIVWRCPRLPKEGQGAYTTHQLVCRMALTSFDQIPDQLAPYAYVEFTMPATQVSHMTVRSVSVQDSDSDEPPEKYVRYLARHEYKVGIESTSGEPQNAYLAATKIKTIKEESQPQPAVSQAIPSDSDSDSN